MLSLGSDCYYVSTDEVQYTEAVQKCRDMHSEIATITDINDFMTVVDVSKFLNGALEFCPTK